MTNMRDQEILKKVIEKAVKNGFSTGDWFVDGYFEKWLNDGEGKFNQAFALIFSDQFAKAFWGTEEFGKRRIWIKPHNMVVHFGVTNVKGHWKEETIKLKTWKYHLQQLVLTPDDQRIKYLAKFL